MGKLVPLTEHIWVRDTAIVGCIPSHQYGKLIALNVYVNGMGSIRLTGDDARRFIDDQWEQSEEVAAHRSRYRSRDTEEITLTPEREITDEKLRDEDEPF